MGSIFECVSAEAVIPYVSIAWTAGVSAIDIAVIVKNSIKTKVM